MEACGPKPRSDSSRYQSDKYSNDSTELLTAPYTVGQFSPEAQDKPPKAIPVCGTVAAISSDDDYSHP